MSELVLVTKVQTGPCALLATIRGDADVPTEYRFIELLEQILLAEFPLTVLNLSELRHLSVRSARAVAQLDEEVLLAGRRLHVVCGAWRPRVVLDAIGVDHSRRMPRSGVPARMG